MRIVFMGTPEIAATCLKKLISDGFDVAAAYTQPDRPKGRGMKTVYSPVKEAALAAGNRHVGGIDTLALFTAPQYGFISSTLVRDVIRHGGRLDGLVPDGLIERLTQRMK